MLSKKQQISELLQLHYGFDSFRPGQEQAIDHILAGESVAVIMPTGGGKSLIFQLPALVLDGITIVISPLIALMKDQVDGLRKIGIPAAFINSSISPAETKLRLEDVKNNRYKLLYIAPERFYSDEFKNALKEISVSLFAIDEAHCISQWGHDFRPSYLRLREAIDLLGSPPVAALTATATPEVREDIKKQLKLKNCREIVTGFKRKNLQLGVIHASESQKPRIVLDAVLSMPEGAGIIYAGTRSRTDDLLQMLLENDIEAVSYHAGMDPEDRKWVQMNFLSGKAKVIVATNAFGLGINKPDVRYVIHYDMPGTVEAYYQEAGRAGRDGKPSFCLLLYNSRDRALHEFFIKGDNPSVKNITDIYRLLVSGESDTVLLTYSEISEMLIENLPDMAIGTALKLLEKEGYISRYREKNGSAYFKLASEPQKIKQAFGARAKKQIDLFEAISAKYGNEMAAGWQANFEEIAEILEVKKESLMRLIRKLSKEGLAEYRPPFKGTEIRILKRVEPEDLKFDTAALEEKMKRAHAKLAKIEDYVYDFGCRQKYILNYFGDTDPQVCGKCDICLNGHGFKRSTAKIADKPERSGKYIKKKEEEFDVSEPDKRSGLSTKLTQLETFELHNKGYKVNEIAKARNLSEAAVLEHLQFLTKMGLIKK
jgi:ATP-dependent DNA helicase RecQ